LQFNDLVSKTLFFVKIRPTLNKCIS